MKYIGDIDEAKTLVHEVFISMWEKFDSLPADANHRSYLYTAVRNRSLNYLRDKKKHLKLDHIAETYEAPAPASIETDELQREIAIAIESLPEKCRMVFEFNRNQGLKYAEIAEKMNISIKTVEAQMSKALTMLREHLKEFLSILIFLIFE